MSPEVAAAIVAGVVSLVVAIATGIITYVVAERRLREELKLEDATEVAVRTLMSRGWKLRSFSVISHHIRGFKDDELRKLLVRCGAVAFSDPRGNELWGLLDGVPDKLVNKDQLEAQGLEFDEITGLNQHKTLADNDTNDQAKSTSPPQNPGRKPDLGGSDGEEMETQRVVSEGKQAKKTAEPEAEK